MLMWAISYNAPASEVERLSLGTARKNGAPSPTTPQAHQHNDAETQREPEDEYKRILHAAAELAAREGYSSLSHARIVQESGVSDESFFERFQNSEECFLAALQLLCVEAVAMARRGARVGKTWPDAVQLGIKALLDHLATDRTLARVAFVEVFGAGTAGLSLREELLRKIADLCVDDVPDDHSLSPVAAEAIVGAVWAMTYDRIVHNRAHELPALAGYASYMVLAPVIGADAAVQSILAGPLATT
jgi:AcrR family transcriptional regulator